MQDTKLITAYKLAQLINDRLAVEHRRPIMEQQVYRMMDEGRLEYVEVEINGQMKRRIEPFVAEAWMEWYLEFRRIKEYKSPQLVAS